MKKQTVERSWRWRVREVIQAKGLSVSEVARRAGVSHSTVQAFCRDRLHETNLAMWYRLAKALDVPPDELQEDVSAHEEPMDFTPSRDEKPLRTPRL